MAFKNRARWTRRLRAALATWGISGALCASTIGGARAQAPAETVVARTYLNKPLVQLPIEIDGGYRSQIDSLVLYAKEGADGAWSIRDKAQPMQTSFTFRADRDAEYWFRIVAIDKQGRSHPDDLRKDPQDAVVVVVDTAPPAVDVVYLGNVPEGQLIQCDVLDANTDILKTRFYYQTRDQVWRSLESVPEQANVYCVPAQAALTNFIRVVAVDLAGNQSARTLNLSELAQAAPAAAAPKALTPPPAIARQTPPPPPAPVTAPEPVRAPATAVPTPIIIESHVPAEPRTPRPQPINATPAPVAVGSGPSLDLPSGNAAPPADVEVTAGTLSKQPSPNIQLVGSTQVYLNYAVENVGASGVGKMEIYATRDRGQSWQKIAEETHRRNPAEVNLPGEGIFGLKAVVSNGRGFGAQPPQAGDPADWWIEVDATRPKAAITGIRPGAAHEAGSVTIFWQAEDKNLHSESVELYYAPSREGPWTPIGKNLKNTGQHRWQPPTDAGAHAFVRLLVRDKAGNIGLSETTQPVPLDDLSRPRVRLLNVTPSPVASGSNVPSGIVPVQATSSSVDAPPAPPSRQTTSSFGVEVR